MLLLFLPAVLCAAGPLENVRRARALVGAEVWSRIIRIENTNKRSVYPRVTVALVFEFGGILWFYTDTDGTQSFSLRKNNLAAEKAGFGPLLRDIEPGFSSYTILPDNPPFTRQFERTEAPPNACFLESVAELRKLSTRGELVLSARLLSYYIKKSDGLLGHTVLTYKTPRGTFVVDPLVSARPTEVKRGNEGDALSLARALRPDQAVAQARWVPTGFSSTAPLAVSATTARPANRPG